MATYIQGQADYITQIQPTEPNLAFDAQILQTKQAKYDANHKKVSDLYGSLLNSAMTRSDNIQARDEFFKIINDDIRRMGGLDFSLDQNVQAAASVFQSIYTNNNIVKDMVWTKNYNNEVSRSEAFKNCKDVETCGGAWWPEGEKYLQYKREEFKNASAGDALNMSDPEFIPYTNVMEKAIKIAKDAGLSITQDSFSPDGQYIITTKNGVQLKSPLTQLFGETIGKDPNIQKMYQVKSYTQRKDWMYSKINTGEYANENDAAVGYFRERNDAVQKALRKQADDLNVDLGSLSEKYDELSQLYKEGKIKEGSEEYTVLTSLPQLIQNASDAKSYTDMMLKAQGNSGNAKGLSSLGDYADEQSAADYYAADIEKAATILSMKDAEVKFEADDFALKAVDFKYDSALKQQEFQNNVALEGIKQANKMELEQWKLDSGIYNDKINGGSSEAKPADVAAYQNKEIDISKWDPEFEAWKVLKKRPDATKADMANFDPSEFKTDKEKQQWQAAQRDARLSLTKLKNDANAKALKIGESPKYTDVISSINLEKSGISQDYFNNYYQRILDKGQNEMGLDKWTIDQYVTGKKGNVNESVYYQLQKLASERKKWKEKQTQKKKQQEEDDEKNKTK
jgi:hypothetical protein